MNDKNCFSIAVEAIKSEDEKAVLDTINAFPTVVGQKDNVMIIP